MNSQSNLLKRLLKLYPVKTLKDHFDPDETTQAEMIPEIVRKNNADSIKQFALDSHNYTKQHVFFFKLDRKFDRPSFGFSDCDLDLEQEVVLNGGYNFKFLPKIEYDVVLGDPFEEIVLKFYQPVLARVVDKILIIQTTIMEKKLEYYFDKRRVYDAKKNKGEDYIIKLITDHFQNFYDVSSLDLNKGIKKMWEDDLVDSKYAKWKKSHSTTTEQMDEEYTLKQKYPDDYAKLITSPLNRMIFKSLIEEEDLCSHFSIDPSKGFLTVSIYPDNLEQCNNVINKILEHN